MSNSERRKGAEGEREVAAVLRAAGFDCDRTPNSGALRLRGDLYGDLPDLHFEVKRQERWSLPEWLAQAEREAPDRALPVVAFRRNRGEWYAAVPLMGLAKLLGEAAEFRRFAEGATDERYKFA